MNKLFRKKVFRLSTPHEYSSNWIIRLFHRQMAVCRLCDKPIMDITIEKNKEGWAALWGVKEDFILCPWCYDKYDIKLK